MLEGLRSRVRAIGSRLRRIERRERRELRAWLENTRNLIRLSALLFVPALLGFVTALSNAVPALPFLLFPPLASGAYTLFSEPESEYASPRRFVGGLTLGAVCGWIALEVVGRYGYGSSPGTFEAHAGAAAFAIFLTGSFTWLLDLEEAQSFSTALLVLLTEPLGTNADGTVIGVFPGRTGAAIAYVFSVFVATSLVAAAFVGWRRWFFERRAHLLYASTTADDAVLVPIRGDRPGATAMLGARLAAAHEAGKVVLLEVVDRESVDDVLDGQSPNGLDDTGSEEETDDREEQAAGGHPTHSSARSGPDADQGDPTPDGGDGRTRAETRVGTETAERIEEYAREIEAETNVPCQVAVVAGNEDDPTTVLAAARKTECDLIVAPYESREGHDREGPSGFVRDLLHGGLDVLVHRSKKGRDDWQRALVPVRRESDIAHAMVDFATRLVGDGTVSVCHCLTRDRDRRRAERMLTRLLEPFDGNADSVDCDFESRVVGDTPEAFVADRATQYDIVLVGASTDRSTVSRIVSTPTAERITELDSDLAIVATARE
ncbi:HPP family protein [Halobiforma lacisalsi AJ5]|uniref:HPP family protein n=1 Tax=Natronobacterium lacisalsi AJ5 TaxID=358396 RepID=M0LNF2_NATLA|nr:HPP family protein [Halobiforma lacisalsi]APW96809.1 HPP family protein [Halobiforma lacisalsi AJ5]EMA35082.1 hypothetical protein C445_06285 [Halobiforma lacisalsi AJ5]